MSLVAREMELLERAVRLDDESDPSLLDRPLNELVADDLNDLRTAVTVLLIAEGLDQHDNHNALGHDCEDLIDRLSTSCEVVSRHRDEATVAWL